jgi:hypothetical protein
MTTFCKVGPSADKRTSEFASVASVACSTGVVDRGVWLCIAVQYVSFALVEGCVWCSGITVA